MLRKKIKIISLTKASVMNEKQIVVISPSKFPGITGDVSNYSEMISQLVKDGFQVLLICPKNADSSNPDLFPTGVKTIRIPFQPPNHKYDIKNGFTLKYYLRFLLFLLVESITVFRTLRNNRIKYAITRHTIFTMQLPIIFRLLGIRVIADGDLASNALKGQVNRVFLNLVRYYERKIIKFYTYLKVSTSSHAENLQKFGFPKERILVIPVGINIERIPRFSIDDIPEHTFGYFGILEKWQGLDILLNAFELLHKKIPQAKLYIIGKGPLENKLKEIVVNYNLSQNVIFTSMSREKLWHEYFKKFRIVVIPRPKQIDSTDKLMPIKLIESLAAGKPIIVLDIPVMREIPENAVLIVPSEDPEALASAMEELSTDENAMEKYSKAALSSAINYDIRKKIKQIVNALVDGV